MTEWRLPRISCSDLKRLVAVTWAILSGQVSQANAQSIIPLGTLPGGSLTSAVAISGDGSTVIGIGLTASHATHAFRWTQQTGLQDLGPAPGSGQSFAYSVNWDGSAVVGDGGINSHAFRWTSSGGMQDLGTLGTGSSTAYGVSGDGAIVVGYSDYLTDDKSTGFKAFRWSGVMQPAGDASTWANGVSRNGSVWVGYGYAPYWDHAMRWSNGNALDLGTLGGLSSDAFAVSGDGQVVVGGADTNAQSWHAFRWTAIDGMEDLGTLPAPYDYYSEAVATNRDGSIVVGNSRNRSNYFVPFVWTREKGMQSLTEYLLDKGFAETYFWPGDIAGVSADGNAFVVDNLLLTVDRRLELIDPNPDLLRADSEHSYSSHQVQPTSSFSWSLDRMAAASSIITGAACDGITRVLVRWEVPVNGAVTFSIADEDGVPDAVGTLANPGQTPRGTTLSNAPAIKEYGKWYAFAEYIVPTDFFRSPADASATSRPVKFTAEFRPSDGGGTIHAGATLNLVRPPIVLLHGYTGWAQDWAWSMQTDPRFVVWAEGYHQESTLPFWVNIHFAKDGAKRAVDLMRYSRHIAATQASVVGHSMGGVLARLHAANRNNDYFRTGNLGQGDFYKLITLYTPHYGSGFACLAESLLQTPEDRQVVDRFLPQFHISDGAVHDLRPDRGEIQNLPAIDVPTHVIAGIGGFTWLEMNSDPTFPANQLSFLARWVAKAFKIDLLSLTGSSDNDLVVGSTSAFGGVPPAAQSTVGWISPTTQGIHTTGPSEDYVGDEVVRVLLDSKLSWDTFAHGMDRNSGIPLPTACLSSLLRGPGPYFPPAPSGGILIASPTNGATVSPGGFLQISVQSSGGFQPVTTFVSGTLGAAIGNASPMKIWLRVPTDAVGTHVIQAMAINSLSQVAFAPNVTVNVTSNSVMQSIEVLTPWVSIGHASDQFQLTVLGHFSGGVDRDMTSADTGTQYASSDPAVVTTDPNGALLAEHEGTARIFIHNGAFQTYADVVVSHSPCFADLNGDHLVDDADFSVFVVQYDILDCSDASMPPACIADLNADAVVDDSDFVIFVQAYNDLLCP